MDILLLYRELPTAAVIVVPSFFPFTLTDFPHKYHPVLAHSLTHSLTGPTGSLLMKVCGLDLPHLLTFIVNWL